MSNNNFRPPPADLEYSPESEHVSFEFPEDYFTNFDGFMEGYPETNTSGPIENHSNQANEVNNSAGTSSFHHGPAGNGKKLN